MAKDYDDDDRPRRSRDDDDYDDRPRRPSGTAPSGADAFYGHIATVIVGSLLSLCCACIGIIGGGIGLAITKSPDAKRNSMIMLLVGLGMIALNLVLRFVFGFDVQKQLGQ